MLPTAQDIRAWVTADMTLSIVSPANLTGDLVQGAERDSRCSAVILPQHFE